MKVKKKNNMFKNLIKKIEKMFKNFKEYYDKLNRKAKAILWIWVSIFIIIVLLIIFCGINNNKIEKHSVIEHVINESAKKYAEDNNIYGSKEQKALITIEEMIDSKYLDKKEITDKTCTGYALIYVEIDKDSKKEKIKSNSYLKCKNYVTPGYKKQ